jgi:small subunit ribosomal protein S5
VNVVRATLKALTELRSPQEEARRRGRPVSSFRLTGQNRPDANQEA